MNVDRTDSDHVRLSFDVEEGMKLERLINARAGRLTGACLELSGLLDEGWYDMPNRLRQPPHAFDGKAPRPPPSTGR
jgi:hypothetical protein